MPAEQPLSLAAEFPAATAEQWRSLVEGVLAKSGQSLADLDSATADGITVHPLYTGAGEAPATATGLPGQAPYVRGATASGAGLAGWDVRQLHADPDARVTNAAILDDLAAGATSVWLRGIDPADYATALEGVYLDLAPIALDAGAGTLSAATALLELAAARGVDAAELRGSLGADPVGLAARSESTPDLSVLAELVALLTDGSAYPNLQLATVDATVLHDAGATDAQELAYATSVGVTYLRALTEAGLSLDEALARIEFRFALTDAQFPSIAKLRAARRLWARVCELSRGDAPSSGGAGARGQRQHAVTSAAMLTQRDPWVNLLRTTIACFSGAVGGADAITVLPFDHAIGLPDEFARRIARNTSSILRDESSLARVLDAGGGSYFLESLTDSLAQAAWDQFTAVERVGGITVALASGAVAANVAAAREAREKLVATRQAPITGVSEFALITEEKLVRKPAPVQPGGGDFAPHRYAEGFEALRDRTDAHLAATGSRPKIFLAALGPVSAYTARLGFATNLFQAAGIEVVVGSGTPDEIVAGFAASGTTVAGLCSSDKIYAEEAAASAAALKAAGATHVGLAGKPGARIESDRAAGIDGYSFVGVDALGQLQTTLDLLGVAK